MKITLTKLAIGLSAGIATAAGVALRPDIPGAIAAISGFDLGP